MIQYSSPVNDIKTTANGVTVAYTLGGAVKTISGDFCICTMPISVREKTRGDAESVLRMPIAALYKIAWEATRFWEMESRIYGGISFTKEAADLVWYRVQRCSRLQV